MTKLHPLSRIDNGDGTITWVTAPDAQTRAAHLKYPVFKWPKYLEPPDLPEYRPRCVDMLKDPSHD